MPAEAKAGKELFRAAMALRSNLPEGVLWRPAAHGMQKLDLSAYPELLVPENDPKLLAVEQKDMDAVRSAFQHRCWP